MDTEGAMCYIARIKSGSVDSKGIKNSLGKDFHYGNEEGNGGLQCIAENRH